MNRALNIQIPADLYQKIKNEAEDKSVSMAAMVRLICIEYFERKGENLWDSLMSTRKT